jgi:hypothetical protein
MVRHKGHVRKNIGWIYLDLVGFTLIYLDLVGFGSSKRRGDGVVEKQGCSFLQESCDANLCKFMQICANRAKSGMMDLSAGDLY